MINNENRRLPIDEVKKIFKLYGINFRSPLDFKLEDSCGEGFTELSYDWPGTLDFYHVPAKVFNSTCSFTKCNDDKNHPGYTISRCYHKEKYQECCDYLLDTPLIRQCESDSSENCVCPGRYFTREIKSSRTI